MTDTLRQPLFEVAHLAAQDIAALRRDLPSTSYPTLKGVTPWAVGFLVLTVAGLALARRLRRS